MIPSLKSKKKIQNQLENVYKVKFKEIINIPKWEWNYKILKYKKNKLTDEDICSVNDSINTDNSIISDNSYHSNISKEFSEDEFSGSEDFSQDSLFENYYDFYFENDEELMSQEKKNLWCVCNNRFMNDDYLCIKCFKSHKIPKYDIYLPEINLDVSSSMDIFVNRESLSMTNNPIDTILKDVIISNLKLQIIYMNTNPFDINYENDFRDVKINNEIASFIFIDNILNSFIVKDHKDNDIQISTSLNVSLNMFSDKQYELKDCFQLIIDGKVNYEFNKKIIEIGFCKKINLTEIN